MLRIKEICKEKGKTVASLAEKIGMLPSALSRINTGANTTTDTLYKIAAALDVSITELFEPKKEVTLCIEYQGKTKRISESDLIKLFNEK